MNASPPDSAAVIAPPPLLYLAALGIGFILQFVFPESIVTAAVSLRSIGLLLMAISAVIARWAFVTMRRIGTSASPREQSNALAIRGPFRFSRNPIYVAMTGLYLGIACVANSWWPLSLLLPLLVIMQWGVVLREERYLAKQFGAAYLSYKSATRRWL